MKRRFELWFDCDNATFDDPGLVAGIKRVLKVVRWIVGNNYNLSVGKSAGRAVLDDNGNTIGQWTYRAMPDNMRIVGVLGLWFGDAPLPEGWRFMFNQDKDANCRFITNMEDKP